MLNKSLTHITYTKVFNNQINTTFFMLYEEEEDRGETGRQGAWKWTVAPRALQSVSPSSQGKRIFSTNGKKKTTSERPSRRRNMMLTVLGYIHVINTAGSRANVTSIGLGFFVLFFYVYKIKNSKLLCVAHLGVSPRELVFTVCPSGYSRPRPAAGCLHAVSQGGVPVSVRVPAVGLQARSHAHVLREDVGDVIPGMTIEPLLQPFLVKVVP